MREPSTRPRRDRPAGTLLSPPRAPSPIGPDVTFEVDEDVVRISGTALTIAARDEAIVAAAALAHGSVVVDAIRVTGVGPFLRADEEIATEVARLLHGVPAPVRSSMVVRVHRGTVVLSGGIPWAFDREPLLRRIAAVSGVIDLIDAMQVRAGTC